MTLKEYGVQQCDICEAPPRKKLPPGWSREIFTIAHGKREYVMTHLPTCPKGTEEPDPLV